MPEKNTSFPKIKPSTWWILRNKAKESHDTSFTPKSIAEVIKETASFVYSNIFLVLVQIDLIERNGNLTPFGRKWHSDKRYSDVCTDILNKIYPPELLNNIADPLNNREAVMNWFIKNTTANLPEVQQMTDFYLLLLKGDPFEIQETKTITKIIEQTKHYPKINPSSWWTIRSKAKETPFLAFTPRSIANLLNVKVGSLYNTVLPSLRQFNIFDKQGKLTKNGQKWIQDDSYKQFCSDLIKETYPSDLIDDIYDPENNRQALIDWFLKNTHLPMPLINQMIATYLILHKGDYKESTAIKHFRKTGIQQTIFDKGIVPASQPMEKEIEMKKDTEELKPAINIVHETGLAAKSSSSSEEVTSDTEKNLTESITSEEKQHIRTSTFERAPKREYKHKESNVPTGNMNVKKGFIKKIPQFVEKRAEYFDSRQPYKPDTKKIEIVVPKSGLAPGVQIKIHINISLDITNDRFVDIFSILSKYLTL